MRPSTAEADFRADKGQTGRRAAVVAAAEAVFGDRGDAAAFLHAPHPELGGLTPLRAARSAKGAAQVKRVLHALTHGLPV
jgi:uncharacterized protein (DUF2384 family)